MLTEIAANVGKMSSGNERRNNLHRLQVQHLPWECVPSLSNVSISRMPSLYHLNSQLSYLTTQKSSILHTGIDRQKVFYVLNPDSNLASTQETFQDWFSREESWEGIINRKPTKAEYTEALQHKDLFLYCGHGTGGAYLGGSDLASLECRAATILMGCSSGKLEAMGHLEATGFMLNYFMAGCPCMLANLWDVTDKDIDRFLACLLSCWLSDEPATDQRKLLDVIPKARAACRLPHLIGAAPVVYGFPVFLKPS